MFDLVIHQARLLSREAPVDLGVQKGRITCIGDLSRAVALKRIQADGHLVLPPLVESHIHLDTVLTAGTPRWNESGTLFEGIGIWQERKAALTREDVMARAMTVIESQMKQGILFVRTQADISDPELTALRALLEGPGPRGALHDDPDHRLSTGRADCLYGQSGPAGGGHPSRRRRHRRHPPLRADPGSGRRLAADLLRAGQTL
ncbi:hypothetical protein ACHHV8_18350 [Paenibacillus sp. TAB 01]|uniref:hypothetical protein n=1 Tax=Paenibacillus sp. TAB 01 TaxID=3368988 RepID=UPI003752605E